MIANCHVIACYDMDGSAMFGGCLRYAKSGGQHAIHCAIAMQSGCIQLTEPIV